MKRVTLTFDNGPTAIVTPFVLDQLRQRGLVAQFCIVGDQLTAAGGVELILRELEEGHRIINHSLSHGIALGDDPTSEHAAREIVEMHDLMNETLGDWGDNWFRPVGRGGQLGSHIFSKASLDQLVNLRYSVLLWNSVPRDWEDPEGWVETALSDVDKSNHTVVVLHDLPTGAMRHLPRFLDELGRREIVVTAQTPTDCTPLRDGVVTWDLAALQRLTSE